MMFRRDYLKKHAVKYRSEANWIKYCKLRNKVNNKLKTCKRNYFVQNLEANGNTKKTWKLLNNLLNRPTKGTNVNILKNESGIISDEFTRSLE
jgi:hypothetical protein